MTVREVVSEIRDKATRRRLQVLPYDLKFREPASDAIRIGTHVSFFGVAVQIIISSFYGFQLMLQAAKFLFLFIHLSFSYGVQ